VSSARSWQEAPVTAVVFDLGGVVVDWDPRHLYRQLFTENHELDTFLDEICTLAWHAQHDGGRPMAETIPLLVEQHPAYASEIRAWRKRYVDMIAGYVDGIPELIDELRALGLPLYALTNMPADVLGELLAAHPVLAGFDGMVVSGEELVMKPDPEIYRRLATRFGLVPHQTVFVDDVAANVDAAWELGFRAVRFESGAHLRDVLARWGVPLDGRTPSG
jgi:2-haloacid dehalogenase